MPKRTFFYLLGGVVIGIFYAWFNTYNDPTLFGIRLRTMLMTGCSILAFLLCYYETKKPLALAAYIAAGVAIAVILRIVWDVSFVDNTSHNRAPFEIAIASGLAFITSLIGGFIGKLVGKANRKDQPNN